MIRNGYKEKPIMGVWSMKHKTNPLGMIVKYKARWCAHGGQTIKGVHYENTYAPVVTWTTIRFLLTLALINNWHTYPKDKRFERAEYVCWRNSTASWRNSTTVTTYQGFRL